MLEGTEALPYAYSSLVLWSPETQLPEPEANGGSGRLEGAGRALNHGILVAEALGIPSEKTRQILDDIDLMSQGAPRLLFEEDLAELVATYCGAASALRNAIDGDGRPAGPVGTRLLESIHFNRDEGGFLFVRAGRLPVLDLRDELDRLCQFLKWASSSGYLVMKEQQLAD